MCVRVYVSALHVSERETALRAPFAVNALPNGSWNADIRTCSRTDPHCVIDLSPVVHTCTLLLVVPATAPVSQPVLPPLNLLPAAAQSDSGLLRRVQVLELTVLNERQRADLSALQHAQVRV